MAKPCACKKPAECEECPEWIFTFADLVMLMMGFFVILFVLKPEGKPSAGVSAADQQAHMDNVVIGIREAFDYKPDPNSHERIDELMRMPKARGEKEGSENPVPRDSAQGIADKTTTVRPGNHSLVGDRIGFDAGSLELLPEFAKSLDGMAEKIKGHLNIVMIKGHSGLDDVPDEAPHKLMDLSLRRAQIVASYLISKGVNPEILRVEGCSTFEPVLERAYGPNGQADNRRVEVESTTELTTDRRDQSKTPAAPIDENADAPKRQE